MGVYLGIDTSCYTTSVACVDETGIVYDKRTVLCVKLGERGLRQSDGLFQHVRNLDALLPELIRGAGKEQIRAVAVSVRPRPDEKSYMPVFLAGRMAADTLCAALGLAPTYTSHQQGHIRAALVQNEALIAGGQPFLGMHLSGGTTEVFEMQAGLSTLLLGGTTDLHAGQFVDRLGVRMGLPFPCGRHMEALAREAGQSNVKLPASVNGLNCSFSGVETAAQALQGRMGDAELAYAAYDCMARTFAKVLLNAVALAGHNKVLLAGGVASSELLRRLLRERLAQHEIELHFALPELSGDNAVGVALLAKDESQPCGGGCAR
ncbi:MAG: O-sialoglycoprotein endopeptidase [Christensenellaceae bacterium]|jgi:N6-L-threonylcarbamoyladenine synthase|nr:O-sialoglycoprotein endopeptidase [Christensenellaceae bacterium]